VCGGGAVADVANSPPEIYETPVATTNQSNVQDDSPSQFTISRSEHSTQVSAHIRQLTYGNKPTTIPPCLLTPKNDSQNNIHTVN
jgi:hypothetical protein